MAACPLGSGQSRASRDLRQHFRKQITEMGTFQIPVDSAEETSGGDMMVIARES
jgi:hypothetical protein